MLFRTRRSLPVALASALAGSSGDGLAEFLGGVGSCDEEVDEGCGPRNCRVVAAVATLSSTKLSRVIRTLCEHAIQGTYQHGLQTEVTFDFEVNS